MNKVSKKQKESDSQYLDQLENYMSKMKGSLRKEKSWEKWSIEENIIYIQFMEKHRELFLDQFTRRSKRVFLKLSEILETRTPDQCRTHHQKMQTKCKGNIQQIILEMREKITLSLERRRAKNDRNASELLLRFREQQKMGRQITKNSNTENTQVSAENVGYSLYISESNRFRVEIDPQLLEIW